MRSFSTLEEMLAAQAEDERAANAAVTAEQAALRDRTDEFHVTRAVQHPTHPDPMIVFGRVWALDVYAADAEMSLAEAQALRQRGYLYGTWSSVVVPDGEEGSAHCSTVFEVSPEVYDEVAATGWRVTAETPAASARLLEIVKAVYVELDRQHRPSRRHP